MSRKSYRKTEEKQRIQSVEDWLQELGFVEELSSEQKEENFHVNLFYLDLDWFDDNG